MATAFTYRSVPPDPKEGASTGSTRSRSFGWRSFHLRSRPLHCAEPIKSSAMILVPLWFRNRDRYALGNIATVRLHSELRHRRYAR